MARPPQAPNMDAFDAYFRRADLDQDGRISGNEAVAFFQGSNLPKQVLAQIWMYADQNRTGFLGRAEFYNALRLVTVAQSGRELTPDIVKAALFTPAAAKIPPPQMSPTSAVTPQMGAVASPVTQMNSVAPAAVQMNAVTQPAFHLNSGLQLMPQNPGFRGPQQNILMNQQFPQTLDKQFTKIPSAQIPPSMSQGINQGGLPGAVTGSCPPVSNASAAWPGAKMGSTPMGVGTQVLNRGVVAPIASLDLVGQGSSAAASSISSKPSNTALSALQPLSKDPKGSVSGNGLSVDSMFGGDVFSAASSQPRQAIVPSTTFAMTNISSSSAIVPVTSSGVQSSSKQGFDTIQGFLGKATGGEQLQQASSLVNQNLFGAHVTPATGSGVSLGFAGPATTQVKHPWPSMTQSDIQRYNAIFIEVDTDRDGKITGEQARNLFLSWRLPREVLKQVWDLSDQDNDSMLSLKEFCLALYLMERYREGRPLPSVLPNSIKFDEALLPPVSEQASMFGGTSWRPQHGFPQEMPSGMSAGIKSVQGHQMPLGDVGQPLPQKSRVPVSEKHLVNRMSMDEQHINSKLLEATDSEKKVEGLEKEILDSKEKIEYYRTKMQDLVLYKSRCDNRLNEIMERASADRNEVESLAKKYEEKYKQVGEIASKLAVEDATFRDIQERKLELFNALVKMEQGGSADGLLQVRVDKIQSDLEGLVKALSERCKHHSLQLKATALVELPYGWQPGIQNGAVEWNDDWDKFEEEGFTFVQELTVEAEKVPSAKPKPPSVWNEKSVSRDAFSVESSLNIDPVEKPSITGQDIAEDGSPHVQNEDEFTNGGPVSPAVSGLGSPHRELPPPQYDKGFRLDSFASFKESHSEHAVSEPSHSNHKFDEPSWGATFSDTNDDIDSVWGFNAVSSKDPGHEKRNIDHFFGADDVGLNPIKTGSPSASSLFGNKDKSPFFGDSVPGTPMLYSNSPKLSTGSDDHQFGSAFLKFDSFSIHDNASPRHDGTLARFDSIRSSRDFDHSRGFSFDDTDLFGSTGPFKSDNSTVQQTSDSWRAF